MLKSQLICQNICTSDVFQLIDLRSFTCVKGYSSQQNKTHVKTYNETDL